MLFGNFTFTLALLVISTFLLQRALHFFTSKVNSDSNLYLRLQRVTRFRSKALVAGGVPIALVMSSLFFFELVFAPRSQFYTAATFFTFVVIGIIDDIFELRSLFKLALQVMALGFWVTGHAFSGDSLIVCAGTMIVSLGLTNSVNLLDGIDTLSTRLGQIGLIYFALICFSFGLYFESSLAVFLLTSLTIFSRYNRGLNPLYLGETGVNVISITYIALSYALFKKVSITHGRHEAAFLALMPLGFYGSEILISFTRRLASGRSPFIKDQLHLHHVLTQKFGYSPFKSAYMLAILYFSSITIGAAANFVFDLNPYLALTLSFGFCLSSQIYIARNFWSFRPITEGFAQLFFRRAVHEIPSNVIELRPVQGKSEAVANDDQKSDKLAS